MANPIKVQLKKNQNFSYEVSHAYTTIPLYISLLNKVTN